jgi:hypothetical protein
MDVHCLLGIWLWFCWDPDLSFICHFVSSLSTLSNGEWHLLYLDLLFLGFVQMMYSALHGKQLVVIVARPKLNLQLAGTYLDDACITNSASICF